jgi:lipopolysaccharide/colanic/teichoic acid biosynthesis glycosyltransferase
MTKRIFDIMIAALTLVALSPVLLVIALLVRAQSRGPVIFRQERVGMHGRLFRIHKFRTMRCDQPGPLVSTTTDGRITRFGAFLRRTKLDELPQLIDVLQGTMSLVGPRPEVPGYVERWPPAERRMILAVRPGITDPATLELRHEARELAAVDDVESYYVNVLLPRKVAIYVDYVTARSFGEDLRIIARTFRAVMT